MQAREGHDVSKQGLGLLSLQCVFWTSEKVLGITLPFLSTCNSYVGYLRVSLSHRLLVDKRGQLARISFSFSFCLCHVSLADWTQVIRIGEKHFFFSAKPSFWWTFPHFCSCLEDSELCLTDTHTIFFIVCFVFWLLFRPSLRLLTLILFLKHGCFSRCWTQSLHDLNLQHQQHMMWFLFICFKIFLPFWLFI